MTYLESSLPLISEPSLHGHKPVMTYLMSTYNKLPFLREVINRLLVNMSNDEELVVIDGGSTDGSVEYLKDLYSDGKIASFLSEHDFGEAHGFNKGLLLANGELIKIISDDDAFHWSTIRKCRDFMIGNPQVDLLGTNGGVLDLRQTNPFNLVSYENDYLRYKTRRVPFAFCGLGLLIRKSSLPILGLFDTNYMRVDAEYSLRITASKANLAWCKSPSWLRIVNPFSNSVRQTNRGVVEGEKLDQLYFNRFVAHRKLIREFKNYARPIKRIFVKSQMYGSSDMNWSEIFIQSDEWLERCSQSSADIFMTV